MTKHKRQGMTTCSPLWLAVVLLKQQHVKALRVFFHKNSLLLSCKDGWQKEKGTKQNSRIYSLGQSRAAFVPHLLPHQHAKAEHKVQSQREENSKATPENTFNIDIYIYIFIYIHFFPGLQLHSFYCSCHAGSPRSATTSCLMSPTAKLLKYFTTSQEQRDECERVQNHLGRPREESLVLIHLKVLWTFAGI